MKTENLSEQLLDIGVEDALVMDGYNDCVIGILERFGMESIVLYDKEKVLGKLVMMAAPMKRLSNSTNTIS